MSPRRAAIVLATAIALVGGCASDGGGPIFPAVFPALVWPKPPDTPRIRYIGQLAGEADLKAPRPFSLAAALAGPPPMAKFSTPTAVAISGERVYVADGQLGCVHVLDLERRTYGAIREAGGQLFKTPNDVVVAESNLVVSDAAARRVSAFDLAGRFVRHLGPSAFQRPAGLAWDPGSQTLWVVDAGAHACALLDLNGGTRGSIGQRGAGPAQFNFPAGGGAAEGTVAIADSMNFRVQLLTPDGQPLSQFGQKGDAAGDFALPRDVAMDSQRNVYVLDSQFENVQIFDPQGRLLMAFGQEGRGPGEFYLPSGITIDARDRIWIADTYNRRVQVFQFLREAES